MTSEFNIVPQLTAKFIQENKKNETPLIIKNHAESLELSSINMGIMNEELPDLSKN